MIVAVATFFQVAQAGLCGDKPAPKFLTGKAFRQELGRPFSGSWSEEGLRNMLQPVSSNRQVSIVIDRRIDPSAEYQISLTNLSLLAALQKIADLSGGQLSLLDNLVYFGPPRSAGSLRTLIELRTQELKSKDAAIADRRRTELQRRKTMAWSDLTTPREILSSLRSQFHLKIKNEELIRHDLWAGSTLPEVTATEVLSIVLIQFDFTFEWQDAGESIEILPMPDRVGISRKYRWSTNLADALEVIKIQFPQAEIEASKPETTVNGTIEVHEAITSLMKGESKARTVKEEPLGPIKSRSFTFGVEQPVPISAIMKELEKSKIQFEYDPEEMKSAGVDLEQLVQFEVKNASASKFFSAIFEKAGIEFEFDQTTVKLKPARRR